MIVSVLLFVSLIVLIISSTLYEVHDQSMLLKRCSLYSVAVIVSLIGIMGLM